MRPEATPPSLLGIQTSHHGQYSVPQLLAAKGDTHISVVLPARDEETTVGTIVETIVDELVDGSGLVDETIVIDSGSTDRTAAVAADAGAHVVDAADVFCELGPALGKGDALWRSLAAVKGDVIVWLDSDIEDFHPRFALGVLGPILTDPHVVLSKGFYERPIRAADGSWASTGGGRVTELLARPLLAMFFPQLAGIVQPLSGEYAVRRAAVEAVPFAAGYGVEVGLLVDLWRRHGRSAIAQVDLERRLHRNRPLAQLGRTAFEVAHALLARVDGDTAMADTFERITAEFHIESVPVEVVERPPMSEFRKARR
jgi:glucosyl-3-phosphoglycerate synthase